ncbi:hypothetical protein BH10BAC2_BH10BAC2_29600 [soil metagenome]
MWNFAKIASQCAGKNESLLLTDTTAKVCDATTAAIKNFSWVQKNTHRSKENNAASSCFPSFISAVIISAASTLNVMPFPPKPNA